MSEIEYLIQEKRQIEGLIAKLINDFIDKTGLAVDDILLERLYIEDGRRLREVEVTLSVKVE